MNSLDCKFHSDSKISSKKKRMRRSSSIKLPRTSNDCPQNIISPALIFLSRNSRKDAFGTMIEKGSKKHKVSFVDTIDTPKSLVEYAEYKEPKERKKIILIKPLKPKVKEENQSEVYHINYKRRRTNSVDIEPVKNKDKVNCELCIVF